MTMMYVTYTGDTSTRFDRQYYVQKHLPLVMESWGPLGLETAEAFFPAGTGGRMVALCACRFRDEAALQACLQSAETARVMADLPHFTDVKAVQSRVVAL